MDDARLDREIEALVAIDPAPDFGARVRERIANGPPMRRPAAAWRISWAVAGGGALAAGAFLAAIVMRPAPEPREPAQLGGRLIEGAWYHAPPRLAAPARASRAGSRGGAERRAAAVPTEHVVDVIVDPLEAAAWRSLMTRVASGDLDLSRLARARDEPAPLPLPEELVLPPIVIEPLTPESGEQGGHP